MSYGRTEIPVVVINHVKVLDGAEITEDRLAEEIRLAEAGAYAGNDTLQVVKIPLQTRGTSR